MNQRKIKRIALVYKNSVYGKIFRSSSSLFRRIWISEKTVGRLREAHDNHFASLQKVEAALKEYNIYCDKFKRGECHDFKKYDLIVTIGGDGTFLETARSLASQLILGVNSDRQWSTGRFCESDAKTFPKFLHNILEKKYHVRKVQRLRLFLNRKMLPFNVLNDFLVCHKNPAAMSHYLLLTKKIEEEQRSSGLWVSTAAGSTAAVFSAGGKKLPMTSTQIQYLPRELYCDGRCEYRLRGGILKASEKLEIISCMTQGMIFIDGTYLRIPFYFGSQLSVRPSSESLNMLIK